MDIAPVTGAILSMVEQKESVVVGRSECGLSIVPVILRVLGGKQQNQVHGDG